MAAISIDQNTVNEGDGKGNNRWGIYRRIFNEK
jgi:hypothetical protein